MYRLHWYGGVIDGTTAGVGYLELIWIVLETVLHGQ
jgi:hypothetical protein